MNLKSPLLQSDVDLFLNDYVQNSQVELISAAKKSELVKLAEKKGIISGSQDLGLFRNVYAFSDIANKNGDRLPDEVFQRALPTIVMKPVNVGHKRIISGYAPNGEPIVELKRVPVVGVYFDYVYRAKEKLAITYGVFFKAIYPELWKEAKQMMKAGKLKSSYEAWCPESKKEELPDGTFALNFIEFAGGSLLFDDRVVHPDHEPAFDGAAVLEIACKNQPILVDNKILTFATVNPKEIIVASALQNEVQIKAESKPAATDEVKPVLPHNATNFKLDCLACGARVSTIESEEGRKATVRCDVCNSRYEIEFARKEKEFMKEFPILLGASVNCPQCQKSNDFYYCLNDKEQVREITCVQCSMKFPAATPEMKEIKPIISVRDLEPYIPETENADDDGMQLTQSSKGVSIESQAEEVSENLLNKNKEENIIQEDDVDKAMYYASLRKAAGKIRSLRKEIDSMQSESMIKIDKLEKRVRKACGKYVNATKLYKASKDQIESTKAECDAKVEMYMANAQKLIERKNQLGDFGKDMTDEQIFSDKDFELACMKKEVAELRAKLEEKPVTKEQEMTVASVNEVQEDPIAVTTKDANTVVGNGYYDNEEQRKKVDSHCLAE